MKKSFMIIAIAFFGVIIMGVLLFIIISATSDKLVCKSKEGNITIRYNSKGLTGYKTSGIGYDLDTQKEVAKKTGVELYIKQFSAWFKNNTTGTCEKK